LKIILINQVFINNLVNFTTNKIFNVMLNQFDNPNSTSKMSLAFSNISLNQRMSFMNFLLTIGVCDGNLSDIEKEIEYLNNFNSIFNVSSNKSSEYLHTYGHKRMYEDLITLTDNQKEYLIIAAYGMINCDGPPNEIEIEVLNFSCEKIGVSKHQIITSSYKYHLLEDLLETKPFPSKCIYKEVSVGNQIWMTENLNVDKFCNGELIPQAKTDEEWINAGENKQPAWCYYDNNPENGEKYGKLYNWYAVNDPRGLAPVGWHVPSDSEWTILADFLGGEHESNVADFLGGMGKAVTKMKSIYGWKSGVIGSNTSGLSCLPSGTRGVDGDFVLAGFTGFWWCSTENDVNSAYCRRMGCKGGSGYRLINDKELGFSIRCVKN
jgi:uncharacterized protein (TIGR02145 family)